MQLRQLIEKYPDLLTQFLDLSGTSIILLADENFNLILCNHNLKHKLHLSRDPLGIKLASILCPLEESELNLIGSHPGSTPVPQILQLCNTDNLYRCYCYRVEKGYLILGDQTGSTENEILQSMTYLNNELSDLSRELSKKNRELERANERIKELARQDYLTGLFNRRYFQERLKEMVALSRRHNLFFSLLLLDIDHFKTVNDTYGHDAGDEVLSALGEILLRESRQEDLAARFGGEELILMLPQTSAREVLAQDKRIRERFALKELPVSEQITFSSGIAEYSQRDSEDSLIKKADMALYQAKEGGRNRGVIYEETNGA